MFPDVTGAREHINGTGPQGARRPAAGPRTQHAFRASRMWRWLRPGRSLLLTLSRPSSADRRENAQADRDSESASGLPTMGMVVSTTPAPAGDAKPASLFLPSIAP